MTVKSKIEIYKDAFESMPGISVINEVDGLKPLFMTRNGLELLEISLDELLELGAEYQHTFFKPEDIGMFFEKFQDLISSGNSNDTFTFFHQVKYHGKFHWYAASIKVFHMENGRATHTITYAVPLEDYPWTVKRAENLLQEAIFAKKNLNRYSRLSQREIEVLPLIAAGKKTAEIAEDLKVSVNTVNSHLKSIKTKLETTSSYDLLKFAKAYDLL